MAPISDYSINDRFPAKVVRSVRLTPEDTDEIREIELKVQSEDFDVQIDQSFGVLVKTDGTFGNRVHHRLYSVADIPIEREGAVFLTMLVKRCFYVDPFSGEKYPGIASNYLCDRHIGDSVLLTGPHQLPFRVPDDPKANMILIGMGTGIAPFRAFIKHIYRNIGDWEGKIRLFYGARSGLEMLYLNDEDGDLTNYYDKETFEAFKAVSPRPHWSDPIALDMTIEGKANEIIDMLNSSKTYMYVAGYEAVMDHLDKAFSNILGSEEAWRTRKAELVAGKKWAEIIY